MPKSNLEKFLSWKPNAVEAEYEKLRVKAIRSNDSAKIQQAEDSYTKSREDEERRQQIQWSGWQWKLANIAIPLMAVLWLCNVGDMQSNPLLTEIIKPVAYIYIYKYVKKDAKQEAKEIETGYSDLGLTKGQ